jgi:hypothetical protein
MRFDPIFHDFVRVFNLYSLTKTGLRFLSDFAYFQAIRTIFAHPIE